MNDGFSESKEGGKLTWLKQWSYVIVDVELFMMSQSARESREFFPDYVYYGATPQDVEEHERAESARRPSEGPIDNRILTDVVKDNSQQRNLLTVRQDVKYVLRNQLRIEGLMKKSHSNSETNSGLSKQDGKSEAAPSQDKVSSSHSTHNDVEPRGDSSLGRVIHEIGDAAHGLLRTLNKYKKASLISAKDEVYYDKGHPSTFYLYYDDDIYGAALIENLTGAKYPMKLLYSADTKSYYVYYRHDGIDHKLDGPYGTIKVAKLAFRNAYKEKFGVEWVYPKKAVYERWKYDEGACKAIEEAKDVEVAVNEITTEDAGTSSTAEGKATVVVDSTNEDLIEPETVAAAVSSGAGITKALKRVAKGAVKALTSHKAHADKGTGTSSTADADTKTDCEDKGDAAQKDTTPKAKSRVDEFCPILKTSHVCCDNEDEYSAVLTNKTSDVECVIQLLCSDETGTYYVYYRYDETETHLDGIHKNIESAKDAFKKAFKEKFKIEWSERGAGSEHWKSETKTHDIISREEGSAFKFVFDAAAVVEGEEVDNVTYTSDDHLAPTEGSPAGGPTEQRSDDLSAFNIKRQTAKSFYGDQGV
ncbi:hypothetical protein BGX26_000301 [Mortierella sp. AD094]|nr:hypothetical protein BGX26_000301 [Mortierella sp. AD094]